MARLTLNDGITVRDVGKLTFFLGRLLQKLKGQAGESREQEVDQELISLEELVSAHLFAEKPMLQKLDDSQENSKLSEMSGTVVRFHYDERIGDVNLVNVVVPEIKGKKIEELYQEIVEQFGERLEGLSNHYTHDTDSNGDQTDEDFDLDDYAFESLGSIVILSCHG